MLISISRRKYVGDKHPLYGVHYMWINNGFVNKRFNGMKFLKVGVEEEQDEN